MKRAWGRTEGRRKPFLPTTQSHGHCSRSQFWNQFLYPKRYVPSPWHLPLSQSSPPSGIAVCRYGLGFSGDDLGLRSGHDLTMSVVLELPHPRGPVLGLDPSSRRPCVVRGKVVVPLQRPQLFKTYPPYRGIEKQGIHAALVAIDATERVAAPRWVCVQSPVVPRRRTSASSRTYVKRFKPLTIQDHGNGIGLLVDRCRGSSRIRMETRRLLKAVLSPSE